MPSILETSAPSERGLLASGESARVDNFFLGLSVCAASASINVHVDWSCLNHAPDHFSDEMIRAQVSRDSLPGKMHARKALQCSVDFRLFNLLFGLVLHFFTVVHTSLCEWVLTITLIVVYLLYGEMASVLDNDEGHSVVGVIFSSKFLEEVDEPLGLVGRLVEDGGSEPVDEAECGEGVAQAEVLRVAVGFFDPVGGVLTEAGVHPFCADEELWSCCPVRHDDVDLLEVVLAKDVRRGCGCSGRWCLCLKSLPERVPFFGCDFVEQAHDGARQDSRRRRTRPSGVSIEPGATELIRKPDVQRESGYARRSGGFQVERDTQKLDECVIVGLIRESSALVFNPRVTVLPAGSGISDDAIKDRPRFRLSRWFSGHFVPLLGVGQPGRRGRLAHGRVLIL